MIAVFGAPRELVYKERAAVEAPSGVEVVRRPEPDLRDALEWLQRERGCATIAVEAGPSVSRALYDDPPALDELLLSVYVEPEIPASVRGPDFLAMDRVAKLLPRASCEHVVLEPSGRWVFQRRRTTRAR